MLYPTKKYMHKKLNFFITGKEVPVNTLNPGDTFITRLESTCQVFLSVCYDGYTSNVDIPYVKCVSFCGPEQEERTAVYETNFVLPVEIYTESSYETAY